MLFTYESKNLIYRILTPDDACHILDFYYTNRDCFDAYEPLKQPNFYTLEYQETMARLEQEQYLRGKFARFFIFRKSFPDTIIGCVSFGNITKGAFLNCNIGYKIHKNYQQMGYGFEAVSFLTEVMFNEMGLHRIEAYISPHNNASVSLAIKCGFEYDGIVRDYVFLDGTWCDHVRYTLINRN